MEKLNAILKPRINLRVVISLLLQFEQFQK
jgi:hypothetical protein